MFMQVLHNVHVHQLRDGLTVIALPCVFVGVVSRFTRAAIFASSELQCLQAALRLSVSYHAPPSDTGCI